jgi:hypothetical protein
MTDALARLRADVTREDVLSAIKEYERVGPKRFFSEHGFGPSRSYGLVWDNRRYPHKAILGTAYELATGPASRLRRFRGRQERRRGGAQNAGIRHRGQTIIT